jgi:hypothetical protein
MKTIRTLTSGRKPNREKRQVLGLKKSLERLECRMCCYLRPGNARFPRHKAWGKQLNRVQCHLPNQYMQCLLADPWPIKRQCWLLNFYFEGLLFWNFWSAYIYIYTHIHLYICIHAYDCLAAQSSTAKSVVCFVFAANNRAPSWQRREREFTRGPLVTMTLWRRQQYQKSVWNLTFGSKSD